MKFLVYIDIKFEIQLKEMGIDDKDVLIDVDNKRQTSWTRNDKLLLIIVLLIDLADGTEIELPGWCDF